MNAIELGIVSATVDGVPAAWALDEATERLALTLPDAVGAGESSITIEFTGTKVPLP